MAKFVITANYTDAAMKGMISNPSDRKKAVAPIIEAMGGKVLDFYATTGEHDLIMIVEAPGADSVIPGLIVAGASGTVCNLRTAQAFTTEEFMAAQKTAGSIMAKFQPAG